MATRLSLLHSTLRWLTCSFLMEQLSLIYIQNPPDQLYVFHLYSLRGQIHVFFLFSLAAQYITQRLAHGFSQPQELSHSQADRLSGESAPTNISGLYRGRRRYALGVACIVAQAVHLSTPCQAKQPLNSLSLSYCKTVHSMYKSARAHLSVQSFMDPCASCLSGLHYSIARFPDIADPSGNLAIRTVQPGNTL
jgi:hypothetical protein